MAAPRHKGTCITPLVAALRSHPQRDTFVPPHLQKYLTENVLASAWYPDDDYFALIELVARAAVELKQDNGDVWALMGTLAARRDIGGVEPAGAAAPIPAAQIGLYKHYAAGEGGIAQFFQRAAKVWTQYHDTGHYEIVGKVARRNAVVRRLLGVRVSVKGYARLQAAYVQEYARLVGIGMTVTVLRSTASGARHCEWLCELERTPQAESYVNALPDYVP